MFFLNNLLLIGSIIVFHIILYFFIENKKKSLKFIWKIKWFLIIIFLIHAFTSDNDNTTVLFPQENWNWDWALALSLDGMETGGIMAGKLLAMLTITQVVRFSMKDNEFVQGLSSVGLSNSSAEIIDQIIEVVATEKKENGGGGSGKGRGGGGGGKGKGKGNKKDQNSTEPQNEVKAVDVLLKGNVGSIPKKLVNRLEFSSKKFKNNENASIASSALAITLIRMVKIAPGLPLAPGHKSVLVFPVIIYGINKSKNRFAGLQIGSISGILHFSMGFGKFGPLGILEFSIVGVIIDLLLRLPIKKTNLSFLMGIGAICGLTRISIEILIAYLLLPKDDDSTYVFIIAYLPFIISQVAFGIASGFVSRALLKVQIDE